MRILQWVFPFYTSVGGRERFAQRLIKGLESSGNEVSVVAPAPPSEMEVTDELSFFDSFHLNPYLEVFKSRNSEALDQFSRLEKFVVSREIDVIHFHNPMSIDAPVLRRLSERLGVPVVLTLHGHPGLTWEGNVHEIRNCDFVDRFVAISDFVARETSKSGQVDESRLVTIKNGVSPGLEASSSGREFLFLGRQSSEKGIPQLLTAFKIFSDMNKELSLRLVGSGPQASVVQQIIDSLDLRTRVHLEQWLPESEVRHRIQQSLAVVVPSLWEEPYGLVAAEAMAQGKAVIYSRKGALPEVVGPDGLCGIGFESGDIVRLVSAMRELALNPQRASEMGIRGRERVKDMFSFDMMVNSYLNLYSELSR